MVPGPGPMCHPLLFQVILPPLNSAVLGGFHYNLEARAWTLEPNCLNLNSPPITLTSLLTSAGLMFKTRN